MLFDTVEAATECKRRLSGRTFGGNAVEVHFFSVFLFNSATKPRNPRHTEGFLQLLSFGLDRLKAGEVLECSPKRV